MDRRRFLARTGWVLGAGALATPARRAEGAPSPGELGDWAAVRDEFDLTREWINMACLLFASHPRPVREAIERHRRAFDANPILYVEEHFRDGDQAALRAAAEYLAVEATEIALTDSTTMGAGLLYGGLAIRPDQEILATRHEHFSSDLALRYKARQSGAAYRRVALYDDSAAATKQGLVEALEKAIRPETRIVAVTYVHSSSGVKLPIREMAAAVARANAGRSEDDRALLCVDGVHGLGVEDVTMGDLGCDFFFAGTHKWLFGPRGTGLLWGRQQAWRAVTPTIPPFEGETVRGWLSGEPGEPVRKAAAISPGGYQPYEHRWSVAEAFRFHLTIGKARVERRIHAFAARMKEGLSRMPQVRLHTPMSEELSSGIVCFEVAGLQPAQVVARLKQKRILASTTPYPVSYARLTPGLLNSDEELDATLRAVAGLGRA
jgi:selenocysteine lyase/cysteine desulfurase